MSSNFTNRRRPILSKGLLAALCLAMSGSAAIAQNILFTGTGDAVQMDTGSNVPGGYQYSISADGFRFTSGPADGFSSSIDPANLAPDMGGVAAYRDPGDLLRLVGNIPLGTKDFTIRITVPPDIGGMTEDSAFGILVELGGGIQDAAGGAIINFGFANNGAGNGQDTEYEVLTSTAGFDDVIFFSTIADEGVLGVGGWIELNRVGTTYTIERDGGGDFFALNVLTGTLDSVATNDALFGDSAASGGDETLSNHEVTAVTVYNYMEDDGSLGNADGPTPATNAMHFSRIAMYWDPSHSHTPTPTPGPPTPTPTPPPNAARHWPRY